MRHIKRLGLAIAAVVLVVGASIGSCGDSGADACPGIICNNCAASDCDIECQPGQQETCVGLQFFGDPNPGDLRCAFCD
ncbi:MAG: hypothetical protein AAF436_15460 [Myxococcota bacterium]